MGILDLFARSTHNEVRERIFIWSVCRISCFLRTNKQWFMACQRFFLFDLLKNVHVTIVVILDVFARSAFGDAFLYSVSVVSAWTREHRSHDWWLVRGCYVWQFEKSVHVVIVVILDVFARSAHNDVRERICIKCFCRTIFNPANTEAMIDGWLVSCVVWYFQKMCMLPSCSSLMFSRALLTVTFANAFSCRVSVASTLTCARRRDDSYQVGGCHVWGFQKYVLIANNRGPC